ncbi:hypothetical protein OBV_04340 [Oscillibacter valericigenes Sjm18-20]|nr:hypothetical protein OBV_04340 [Oscillibacter valericigenes Sjm18-20]
MKIQKAVKTQAEKSSKIRRPEDTSRKVNKLSMQVNTPTERNSLILLRAFKPIF